MDYLECLSTPKKPCSKYIRMRNDEKWHKDSKREQPDERPAPAITAVTVVAGWANKRNEEETEDRTNTCEDNRLYYTSCQWMVRIPTDGLAHFSHVVGQAN